MSISEPLIHCPNSACPNPLNAMGRKFCESCQTPLIYRDLWASGSLASQIPPGELISDRYYVAAPQIWLDTHPEKPPHVSSQMSAKISPYLRLYPQCLHIPVVYGVASVGNESANVDIILLENIPVDATGNLYPSIIDAWSKAPAVRQVYWLWQILQLWKPLTELGVASSLLVASNLRVEGWRVRLLELYADPVAPTGNGVSDSQRMLPPQEGQAGLEASSAAPLVKQREKSNLQQLGAAWATWFTEAQPSVGTALQEIYQQMQAGDVMESAIEQQLNRILLQTAAWLHLRLRVAATTDTGPQSYHNEDTCYPSPSDLPSDFSPPSDPLIPYLAIVCDGIGGHEGGEVASQLAVQSIKLQIQALMTEVVEQDEIMSPDLVAEQLAAIIRVANNLIAARNDEQGRSSRRRMGTTLVMALQLPQQVRTPSGVGNSHELYIAHVGDSRAYWITSQYCQLLTLDDDVVTREVRMGRSLYWEARQRPDASALTQAMGTRDSEFLRPTVRRFIVEEDGLLLLCSDGLSDNNWVEQSWADYAEPVLKGQMSLESAVQSLIYLANQKNGHDNTTVVLTYCRVSPEYPVLLNLGEVSSTSIVPLPRLIPQYSEVEPSGEYTQPATPAQQPKPAVVTQRTGQLKGWVVVVCFLLLVITAGGAGLLVSWLVNPSGVEQMRDRWLNPGKEPAQPENSSGSPTPSE